MLVLLHRCSSIFRDRDWYRNDRGYPISCNSTDPISGRTPHLKKEEDICDGVIHCPAAEDEDFERCKERKVFPKSATFPCESKWMDNVTILATNCNSQEECKDGIDEKNCEASRWNLAIVLGCCLFLSTLSSAIVLRCSKVKMIVDNVGDIENYSDKDLEALVGNTQESSQRRKACKVLFDRKMVEHNRFQAKALNAIKVS